jgi:NADH:ubiquinone oxidoreductase subunit 3 (subunit A)
LRGFAVVVVDVVVGVVVVVVVVVVVGLVVIGTERNAISNMRAYECILVVDTYTVYIFISF